MATQSSSNQPADSPPPAAPAVPGSSPGTSPPDPKDSAFKRDLAAALKQTEGKDAPPPTKPTSKAPKPPKSKNEDEGDEGEDEDVISDESDEPDDSDDDSSSDDGDDSDPSHPDVLALNEAKEAVESGDLAGAAEALPWLKPLLQKVDGRAFKALQKERAKTEKAQKSLKKDREDIAEGQRLVDRGMAELRPALDAVNRYHSGDKQAGARALELLLRKPLATVMRDFYDHVKTGPAVSNLERQNAELQARLDKLEGKAPAGKDGAAPDKKADAAKLATFSKAYQKHPLAKLDEDNELRDRAFKVYQDSWDADLETHTVSRKEALDKVLTKERKRAERLTGKRGERQASAPAAAPSNGQKAYKDMTKDERRAFDMQQAVSRSKASANDRRQS